MRLVAAPEQERLLAVDGLTPSERSARATVWAERQDSLFEPDELAAAGRDLELRDGLRPIDGDRRML
jgi:hypothetical protein